MEENESDFYNFIVNLSTNYSIENILRKDSKTIINVILRDYRENIRAAATRGANEAYLCIYVANAKYKKIIPIDSYVRMTNLMLDNFNNFKIESIMETIEKKLHPFKVEAKSLEENLIGITVKWGDNK